MPESDATDNAQQAPPAGEAWQDKILDDAIGYTKRLVTILDSLNEVFRGRGRELEELRHRLALLQDERQTLLEERDSLEARIGSLIGERDELRSSLDERRRGLDQLQDGLAQREAALEARAQEIQGVQDAARDSARQAEELREIVRDLERERQRVRQPSVQAQQEQITLRDSLTRTEQLLELARRDLAGSQEQIARLRDSLDAERAESARREQQLREENGRLAARVAGLIGGIESRRAGAEQPRQPPTSARHARAIESVLEPQGKQGLRSAAPPGATLQDPGARTGGAGAGTPPGPADLAPGSLPLAGTGPQAPGDSPPPTGPHLVDEEVARRRGRFADVLVACTLGSSGQETLQQLRGRISGINEIGMLGVFERRLPQGQGLSLRLLQGDHEFAVSGRVIQTHPSAAAPDAPPAFHHVIRFDHRGPDSVRRLRAFLSS
jgi:hypothetical protein